MGLRIQQNGALTLTCDNDHGMFPVVETWPACWYPDQRRAATEAGWREVRCDRDGSRFLCPACAARGGPRHD